MYTELFKDILIRDLHKVKEELAAYANEQQIWIATETVKNSAGTLCLHLQGNLNHFIGATLGHTGYIRNRPAEFEQRNIARQQLLTGIEETIAVVEQTFATLTDSDLEKEYPLLVLTEKTSTAFFITYLIAHFNYHLGQINYHRRLIQ